ncbi:unnamed protein product [Porites evermanni]|uniref:Mannosyltransferase n=1 Tax=Porites evermanni TaxID=104178 RepID=A0ABN8PPW6_9CNID|nr:unnamed protein product [Porites evermanni]
MAARRQKSGLSATSSESPTDAASSVDDDFEKKLAYSDKSVWSPRPYTIFKLLLSARFCSAFLSNISDCDETFNYWEPVSTKFNGSFLMHTTLGFLTMGSFHFDSQVMFFLSEIKIKLICVLSHWSFVDNFRGIMRQFGNHVARIAAVFMIFSTGMFISAAAFLPSTFAMYMVLLSYGGWFAGNYVVAVLATAAGAIIGWPFSAVLGLPIAWDILIRQRKYMYFVQLCLIALIAILGPLAYIDSHFYGRTVIAPLNIVFYNVFGKGGPSLYGIEPWTFYFLNGFLNFNIVFPMALLALPVCAFVKFIVAQTQEKKFPSSVLPVWLALTGMYIWILIFFTRPHKEERFLFPIYPFVCVYGAVTLTETQKLFHFLFFSNMRQHYAASSTWFAVFVSVLFSLLSLSRSSALYYGYHAPLDLYVELNHMSSTLEHPFPANKRINLCVGKEWYRYPSSFFLPSERWYLQFIRSEFRGQLPKPYSNAPNASKIIPTQMNDMNEEEPSRYISVTKCDFLVDLETGRETEREPDFAKRTKEWEVLLKKPFLDAERSHRVFRAFYIPFVSYRYTTYLNYVLLRSLRKTSAKSKKGKDKEESAS